MKYKKFLLITVVGLLTSIFGFFSVSHVVTFSVMIMAADIVSGVVLALVFSASPNTVYGRADSTVLFNGIIAKLCFLVAACTCCALNGALGVIVSVLVAVKELYSIYGNVRLMHNVMCK